MRYIMSLNTFTEMHKCPTFVFAQRGTIFPIPLSLLRKKNLEICRSLKFLFTFVYKYQPEMLEGQRIISFCLFSCKLFLPSVRIHLQNNLNSPGQIRPVLGILLAKIRGQQLFYSKRLKDDIRLKIIQYTLLFLHLTQEK